MDDDQVVAGIYQNKLQSERFEVEVSCDSRHVLRMLEMEPFDLVILDLSVSEMRGMQVLNAIRSQPGADALPLIVFLNPYLSSQVNTAREAKATRHVTKSDCTPDQMMAMVREVLAIRPFSTAADHDADGARSARSKTEFQTQLAATFFNNAAQRIRELRAGYHTFVNAEQEKQRLSYLFEMYRQARLLASAAGVGGLRKIARLTTALEALLLQLHDKPAGITSSSIRTIAQALDLLAALFELGAGLESEVLVSPAILVVDDEVISREAIYSAIERASLGAIVLDDSVKAEDFLKKTHFDLIFLDVEMPGLSGLDLCAKIRKMATNHATPVVFVTAHTDFESRAQSSLSGGDDFIAKPFLLGELAVKALTWLFKKELDPVSMMNDAPGKKNVAHPRGTQSCGGLAQSPRIPLTIFNIVKSASIHLDPTDIPFAPSWGSLPEGRSKESSIASSIDKTVPIVIADDDPVSRELISAVVSKWGFRSILTQDGREAMSAIRAEEGPVVAILDWMMPGMDGLQVCRRVRESGKPVHIILLTARAAKESLVEGLESGADDYLVKPFDKDELLARIHVGLRVLNLQNALEDRVQELEKALLEIKDLRSHFSVPL